MGDPRQHCSPHCLAPVPCDRLTPSALLSAGLTSIGRCPRTSHSRRTPGPSVSSTFAPPPCLCPPTLCRNSGPGRGDGETGRRKEGWASCRALYLVSASAQPCPHCNPTKHSITCFWKETPEIIKGSYPWEGKWGLGVGGRPTFLSTPFGLCEVLI